MRYLDICTARTPICQSSETRFGQNGISTAVNDQYRAGSSYRLLEGEAGLAIGAAAAAGNAALTWADFRRCICPGSLCYRILIMEIFNKARKSC